MKRETPPEEPFEDEAARGEITRWLAAHRAGDPQALDRLMPYVYEELRRQAHWQLAGKPETLSTTTLVHEVYLKLAGSAGVNAENRRHFFHLAAQAMRQIVVDFARRRRAGKRGGGQQVLSLDDALVGVAAEAEQILALNHALGRLEALDPRLVRVVELRFFAGLSVEEAAEVLEVTARTVKRDWRKARTFLYQEMVPEG